MFLIVCLFIFICSDFYLLFGVAHNLAATLCLYFHLLFACFFVFVEISMCCLRLLTIWQPHCGYNLADNRPPLILTLAHITKVFRYKKYEQLATHYERFSTLEVNFFDWPPLIFTLTKAEKKYIKCARRTWSRGSSNWENIERNVEPCYCDGSVALRRLILIELAIQSYILP